MKEKTTTESNITEIIGLETASSSKTAKRWLLWTIPIIVGVFVWLFFFPGNSAQTLQFKTQPVVRGDLTITINATGNLEPMNQVDVGSELSGIIKDVYVDYNDQVKVGQLLATLDTDQLTAKVQQSKAALESTRSGVLHSEATVKENSTKLERLKKAYELSGGKVPSKSDIEAAEAMFERAKAELAGSKAYVLEAKATLSSNETNLSKAHIVSPINGLVLDRDVEPGQTVAASLQAPVLFTLAENLTQMELHVDVDEADVGQVKENLEAQFTVDAYPDKTFPARISQVRYNSQTSEGVVTYETVLTVDNSELLLRPGMTAMADIVIEKVENKILVPNAALRFTPPTTVTEQISQSTENSSLISKLLPGPPQRKKSSSQNGTSNGTGSEQKVWTQIEGKLSSIQIVSGVSNGILTEIIEGNINVGLELVVNTVKGT